MLLALALVCHTLPAAEPGPEMIADALSERIVSATQSWGELGLNTAVKPPNREARRLRIKDTEYDHGLGQHANGEVLIALDGQFRTFEAEVGIQWHGGTGTSSVVFQVLVDGEKRFDSGVVHEDDPPRPVRVSVDGADDLVLVAADAGDGINSDVANWANARLTRDPSAPRTPPVRVDVAPFGRVVTWDPARTEGTRATRVEEFPAADLFLAADVLPDADGAYTVPADDGRLGCIGLVWHEARFLRTVGLKLANPAELPADPPVRLEYWTGTSFWQGAWKPLDAELEKSPDGCTWHVRDPSHRLATRKVRWILPASQEPIRVTGFSAHTSSRWATAAIRVESTGGASSEKGHVEVYNGVFVDPPAGASAHGCPWDPAEPLRVVVRYARTGRSKADRTVLRFRRGDAAFGVAVEDVVAGPCVYLPHPGVYVTRDPAPAPLDEYLAEIADRKTVLDRVREMPEQTFPAAMENVHHAIQDLGPMMLSLACDERKFVVHREGAIEFKLYDEPSRAFDGKTYRTGRRQWPCRLRPEFGGGDGDEITRHLDGGWLPMPVSEVRDGRVVYRQRTYVAPVDEAPPEGAPDWLRRRAVCVAEYTIENTGSDAADVLVTLGFTDRVEPERPAPARAVDEGVVVAAADGRLLGFVDAAGAAPLTVRSEPGTVYVTGRLAPGRSARCCVCLPAWKLDPDQYAVFRGERDWAAEVEAYWRKMLAPAVEIELPDELLTNVIRASQVHCMLAAGNEERGERIDVWTSADRYGALESESHSVIRGMDMMGHGWFARGGLDFFIRRYNPHGYLTTGYTMMGTGWHLWTLAEHFDRTQDRAWLRAVAPEVARACRWIVAQHEKTERLDARGNKVPQYGLTPPGVIADWGRFTNSTFQAAHYYAGLREAARVLGEIDHPDAPGLSRHADEYRADILRAYRWTQARSPAVPLADGTWVPAYPPILFVFGEVGGFFPGEDGSRAWCKNAMAHQLAVNGVIDPASDETARMLDHMEDVEFLRTGLGDYAEADNRRLWFHLGGFNKCQPYYRRNVEVYALRDDVKPLLRSYFNTIPSLLSRENLSFWEHFHNRGGWNKTHETGWFLCQTRLMLAIQRGADLWLAPFLSRAWLADGETVTVRRAPTRFGPVGYTITSKADSGVIEAVIDPPMRTRPERIVLRVRHPEGKAIRSVTVDGQPHEDFDPAEECVRIAPRSGKISVRLRY